jgi:putative PEP-CTERM system TPR-repeat lipoprotein
MRVSHRTLALFFPALALSAVLVGACAGPIAKRDAFMAKGDEYFKQNKFVEASIEYRKALQQDALYAVGYDKLGDAYMKTGDAKGALSSYVRASDLAPTDIPINLKAGNLLLVARRFQDAKTRARNILVKDSKNVAGLVLLGNALGGLQNLDEAADVAKRAADLDPSRAGLLGNLGVLELARGKADQAERAFLKAVQLEPKSSGPRMALANLYQTVGRWADAEKVLREAIVLDPKSAAVNAALATVLMQTGRAVQAEPFMKVASDSVGTLQASLGMADYYVSVGRLAEALALLEKVSKTDEGFAAALIRTATIEFASGKHEEAHKHLREVLAKDPKNSTALATEARLLLGEYRFDEATSLVNTAIAADPHAAYAYFALGQIYLAKGAIEDARKAFAQALSIDPRRSDAQMELAKIHMGRRELDTAITYARSAIKEDPDNIEPRLILARILTVRPDDLPQAEAELRTLLRRYPNSPEVHTLVGRLYYERGDQTKARQSFEKALQIDPDHVEALSGLTAIDADMRRLPDARARIEARLAANKKPDADLLLLASKVYVATGQFERTEAMLRRMVDLNPNNLDAFNLLGQFYVARKKLPEARKTFDDVVTRQPTSASAQTMVGLLASADGDLQTARKAYEAAVHADPKALAASNNLAWLYANTEGGNLDTALQLAQTARSFLPDNAEVNDTLGFVYYKKQMGSFAIPLFEAAILKDGDNPNFHYHLGLVYAQMGEDAKSRKELETALKLNPRFEGAEYARRVIATLIY